MPLEYGEYYRFYIVKDKVFDLYQIKPSVVLALVSQVGLIILLEIMNQPATTWWSLILLLYLN